MLLFQGWFYESCRLSTPAEKARLRVGTLLEMLMPIGHEPGRKWSLKDQNRISQLAFKTPFQVVQGWEMERRRHRTWWAQLRQPHQLEVPLRKLLLHESPTHA
jgi:hypothetical protein